MLFCRQVNFFPVSGIVTAALAVILFTTSCIRVKEFPRGKPFPYSTELKLENVKLPQSKKIQLRDALYTQLDDSLQVRKVLTLGLRNRILSPPVFDTIYIDRSKTFMTGLLASQGYFNPHITDTFWIDTVRKRNPRKTQIRAYTRFVVNPGNALRYDSVGYDIQIPELQALAMENIDKSLVKKNAQYSTNDISAELDRLLNIYRDNGYYKITREDLYAEHDTVVAALIDPGLDPFEQFELLDSLSRKTREPTINVVFKQRAPKDTSHVAKYTWGKVNIFPDRMLLEQGPSVAPDSVVINGYNIFPTSARFKNSFLARNVSIKPGTLYRQADYFKTINTFNNLGAWEQVDIDIRERNDSSKVLDADVLLYPAKRQSLNVDLETSRNASDVYTQGNLFGMGLNFGIRDRNGFRESISSSSNVRFGVELGPNIIQSVQASFAHNIYIPRFIGFSAPRLSQPRTIINFNTAYTDRRLFFTARSVNTSWGYDWAARNKNFQFTLLNLEYTKVNGGDSLDRVRKSFPSLFNDGLIISQIFGFTDTRTRQNNLSVFKARLESSGLLTGMIKTLDEGALRRFVRLDLEYKHLINRTNSTWAFRVFGGYGYVYGKTKDGDENNLPFFKAYFGGGPYSMRAWSVRRLGPGSSDIFNGVKIDRFGDVKLEGNVEYRFDIGTIFGIKVKSALFTDVGNIWAKTIQNNVELDSAQFNLGRLYSDIAVGTGTSLRFDFDFFLIRLDWAYQVKNPVFAKENDGWFRKLQIKEGQFQLGIGYPF